MPHTGLPFRTAAAGGITGVVGGVFVDASCEYGLASLFDVVFVFVILRAGRTNLRNGTLCDDIQLKTCASMS
ncbi:hypothetical protein Y032_0069g355 [Ancylostoma ceylanicum]|uniref:Uncharacterized protein n=1 Tax=Ancylostoma ceylanicum TaxID=53326 RepID=A0A016TY12_9BILA|nr:hypothetical protein Y032_0069g355 [Ancylostoma ceylanicum]